MGTRRNSIDAHLNWSAKSFDAWAPGHSMTFRALFCAQTTPASTRARQWPCHLPAMGTHSTMKQSMPNTLPALRFAGAQGATTSEAVAADSPPAPWHSASPAVQGSTPRSQPEGSQDTRGETCSRIKRQCPAAARKGRANSAPRCVMLTSTQFKIGDRCLQYNATQPPNACPTTGRQRMAQTESTCSKRNPGRNGRL